MLVGASVPIDSAAAERQRARARFRSDRRLQRPDLLVLGRHAVRATAGSATSAPPAHGRSCRRRAGSIRRRVSISITSSIANGWAKQMMPVPQPGAMWIDGVFTVRDDGGQERLFARNARYLDLATNVEQGLALFNDSTETFQRFQTYALDAPITPQGHAFRHTDRRPRIHLLLADVSERAREGGLVRCDAHLHMGGLHAAAENTGTTPPIRRSTSTRSATRSSAGRRTPIRSATRCWKIWLRKGISTRDELPFRLEDFATAMRFACTVRRSIGTSFAKAGS